MSRLELLPECDLRHLNLNLFNQRQAKERGVKSTRLLLRLSPWVTNGYAQRCARCPNSRALPWRRGTVSHCRTECLILFGAKKLPDLIRGLRQGISDFCKACKDVRDELDQGAFDAGKSLGGIHGKPTAEALTSDNQTAELYDPAVFRNRERVDRVAKGTVNKQFFFSRAASKFKRIL